MRPTDQETIAMEIIVYYSEFLRMSIACHQEAEGVNVGRARQGGVSRDRIGSLE